MRAIHLLLFLALAQPASAATISELGESDVLDRAASFFTPTALGLLAPALIGAVLLGLNCGLLGSFVVVRKMALVGDTLSHAVLPGIALGFLWNMTKSPVAILIGATAAGMLGILTVGAITSTTRVKQDAALGMVLATFYAVGICILTRIADLPGADKAGIDSYLFGQASAIGWPDVKLMLGTTGITFLALGLFYKGFLATSFDREFAGASGVPVPFLDRLLMLLTAFAVVVAMKAVGVVLVSAMLVIPASAAYLLTDRMHQMLLWSAMIGVGSALLGAFVSYLGSGLPTGPFIVLAAALAFALAFFFGPRHGLVPRSLRHRSRSRRIEAENTLKAIYHVMEARGFASPEGATVADVAARRRDPEDLVRARFGRLEADGLATLEDDLAVLTPEGYERACTIVRNHRLWELYLTNVAHYEPDHVHDDAEKIEHILGDDTVRQLERALEFPHSDPHGKPIPSLHDLGHPPSGGQPAHGYG